MARPVSVSSVTGVAQPAQAWASVASELTPARAAHVIREARRGMADDYLTLAEEIEERDHQWATALQTRKMAVAGTDPEVEPGDDSARGEEIAEEFRKQVVEQEWFADLAFDLMDAISKSYSVVQPLWDTSERQWNYKGFQWEDPRHFVFDRATLRELRLKTQDGNDEGAPLRPGAFVVHYPKLKTGVRIRGGLGFLGIIAHVAKSFTLADWLAFCEVYGMPLRYAEYDPATMTQSEIDALKIAIARVGHDAAALIPKGAKFEVLDARRPPANGKNVFEGLANYWDAQTSKVVLGQTMTTDDGSSKSQAEVHEGVAVKIARGDARSLRGTMRAGIIKPWVYFNYGPDAPVPSIRWPVEPPEDLLQFTQAVVPWIEKAGLKVKASEVRAKFGLSAPEDSPDDETLGKPEEPDPVPGMPGAPGQQNARQQQPPGAP